MDKYGSPELKDPTAIIEEDIEAGVAMARKWTEEAMAQVLNRAPGTTQVPKESEHSEWIATINDPNALWQRFQGMAQIIGPQKAAFEMLLWHERHMKRSQTRQREMADGASYGTTD